MHAVKNNGTIRINRMAMMMPARGARRKAATSRPVSAPSTALIATEPYYR
jgi:hypothetical protein